MTKETTRAIITNVDGTVGILIPAPDCPLSLEEIITKGIPAGATYRLVDVLEVPTDRRLRDAWKDTGTSIDLDVAKAQQYIREVRDKRLKELDIEAIAAERAGDTVKQTLIDNTAQVLRDIPTDPRFIGSDEDLKNLYGEI